jgi:hypothetical protein
MEKVRNPQEIQLLQRLIIHNYSLENKWQRACKELADDPEPQKPAVPAKPDAPGKSPKSTPLAKRIAELKKQLAEDAARELEAPTASADDAAAGAAPDAKKSVKDKTKGMEQISIEEAIDSAGKEFTSPSEGLNPSSGPAASPVDERTAAPEHPPAKPKARKFIIAALKEWRAERKENRRARKARRNAHKFARLNWRFDCKRMNKEWKIERKRWKKEKKLARCRARVKALDEMGKYMLSMLEKGDQGLK